MQLKSFFRTIMLGTSLSFLAACASWHSGQKEASSIIDGDTSLASNAQPVGLGDDSSIQSTESEVDHNLATKRTYHFDYDKSQVRDEDRPGIEANAQYLLSHPNAKTLIEGHTDPRGSREYNIALGERRSKAIQALLKEQGVKSSQIRIISYGSEKLAANGHTESAYQLDRRGVLVYLQQ